MKYLTLNILLFAILSCKAQSTTVSIYDDEDYGNDDIYYKDIHNDYNTF